MDFLKINLTDLLEKAETKELVLPNFQRDFVWKTEQQKMLIASFLVNLPIGTFLILEGEKGDFVSKELCFKDSVTPKDNCLFLLDGQQRLSTIKSVFTDLLTIDNWDEKFEKLHFNLRNKWYLDLTDENCIDCFGFDNLNFNDVNKKFILSKKEPNDIIDAIKFHQIYKTKKENKFHPGRKFKKTSESIFDKKLELANLFATDLHIPLFDFLSSDKIIIKNTLKFIAATKLESLKNKTLEDAANNYDLSILYLGHLDSTIQSKYKKGNYDEINQIWNQLKENWVENIIEYFKDLFKNDLMVPNIKSNELSRATSVFEYMNKGGTPLDIFDIMVAKYADVGSEKTLYDELELMLTNEIEIPNSLSNRSEVIMYSNKDSGVFSNEVLSKPIKELFLNFLSVLSVENIENISISNIKKEKILSLKKSEIDNSLEVAEKALTRSIAFLQFRCGINNLNSLSYNLMLIPLGMILKDDAIWNDRFKIDKLEFWYWTALFSGRFREKQNERCISETKELNKWVIKDEDGLIIHQRANSIFSQSDYSDVATLLMQNEDKNVPTAIHNGILQYVLSNSPNDFKLETSKLIPWELAKNGISIQDHHIIPLGSVTSIGESTKLLRKNKLNILNSPLNRTFISQMANQQISSMSIERYLPLLNSAIHYSHCLPDDILTNLSTAKEFQTEYITKRFHKIKNELLAELNRLVPPSL